jgi:hypothetical protein
MELIGGTLDYRLLKSISADGENGEKWSGLKC